MGTGEQIFHPTFFSRQFKNQLLISIQKCLTPLINDLDLNFLMVGKIFKKKILLEGYNGAVRLGLQARCLISPFPPSVLVLYVLRKHLGAFNNHVDKRRGLGGQSNVHEFPSWVPRWSMKSPRGQIQN